MRFDRAPAPSFWVAKERRWLERYREHCRAFDPPKRLPDPLNQWQEDNVLLSAHFHRGVRREPLPLCA